jgi:hypothetical protein
MENTRNVENIWAEKLQEREKQDNEFLKKCAGTWIFRQWDVGLWTGSSWLRIGTDGGHL